MQMRAVRSNANRRNQSSKMVPPTNRLRNSFALASAMISPWVLIAYSTYAITGFWISMLAYLPAILVAAVFMLLGLQVLIEMRVRRHFGMRTEPLLSGVIALSLFFLLPLAKITQPISEQFPFFCTTSQSVEWETTQPHPKYNGNSSFILVLQGYGQLKPNRYDSGHLNWTGDTQSAGFVSLSFFPDRFAFKYRGITRLANRKNIRLAISDAQIPFEEKQVIGDEIFRVLQTANAGHEIRCKFGEVDPVTSWVHFHYALAIPTTIWTVLLFCTLIAVAYPTADPNLNLSTKKGVGKPG